MHMLWLSFATALAGCGGSRTGSPSITRPRTLKT
jgi:hypothetical protein